MQDSTALIVFGMLWGFSLTQLFRCVRQFRRSSPRPYSPRPHLHLFDSARGLTRKGDSLYLKCRRWRCDAWLEVDGK